MRKLTYVLADGAEVATYPQAVESGQRFKEKLTDVKEKTHTSKVRAEILKEQGFVKPKRHF